MSHRFLRGSKVQTERGKGDGKQKRCSLTVRPFVCSSRIAISAEIQGRKEKRLILPQLLDLAEGLTGA